LKLTSVKIVYLKSIKELASGEIKEPQKGGKKQKTKLKFVHSNAWVGACYERRVEVTGL